MGTDESMKVVGVHCKQLRNLRLSFCQKITDESIKVVGEHCRQLVTLALPDCKNITDESIKVVVEHCEQLQALHLWLCNVPEEYNVNLRSHGIKVRSFSGPGCNFEMPGL